MIVDNAINSDAVIKEDAVVDRNTSNLQSHSDVNKIADYPSALIIGIGLIWLAFGAKKQGWHDKLAGAAVVRTR